MAKCCHGVTIRLMISFWLSNKQHILKNLYIYSYHFYVVESYVSSVSQFLSKWSRYSHLTGSKRNHFRRKIFQKRRERNSKLNFICCQLDIGMEGASTSHLRVQKGRFPTDSTKNYFDFFQFRSHLGKFLPLWKRAWNWVSMQFKFISCLRERICFEAKFVRYFPPKGTSNPVQFFSCLCRRTISRMHEIIVFLFSQRAKFFIVSFCLLKETPMNNK